VEKSVIKEVEHQKTKEALERILQSYKRQSLLSTALSLWVVALIIEVIIRTYDLYRIAPDVDVLSHLCAGVAMAATMFWLSDKIKFPHYRFAAIIGTIVFSLLWELTETLQELVIYNPPYLLDFFFWDGFFDVIVALLGAIIFVFVRRNIVHKQGIVS
jgi:hypothetical protein